MPKRPNYQFEKRQKELDRKARKAEKLQRRQERSADDATSSGEDPSAGEAAIDESAVGEPSRDEQPTTGS